MNCFSIMRQIRKCEPHDVMKRLKLVNLINSNYCVLYNQTCMLVECYFHIMKNILLGLSSEKETFRYV